MTYGSRTISNGPSQDNTAIAHAVDTIGGIDYAATKLIDPTEGSTTPIGVAANPMHVQGTVTTSLAISASTRYQGSMTAAALAAGYANLLTPGVAVRKIRIDNFTDGDVVFSLDAAANTHGTIAPGKSYEENYGQNFLTSVDAIHVKDGTKVATSGTVYAVAYSG